VTPAGIRARGGPPLALQIVILLIASLVLALAMTFAILVLAPPPREPVYRTEEIANALRGQDMEPRDGRPLHRQIEAQAPVPPKNVDPFWTEGTRRALAESLKTPVESLVLFQRPQSRLQRILRGAATPAGPPNRRGGRSGPGPAPDGTPRFEVRRIEGPPTATPAATTGPPSPTPEVRRTPAGRAGDGRGGRRFFRPGPVFGVFTAAWKQPDGRWVVVTPEHEPFPTDWQKRLAIWLLGCLFIATSAGYLFARRITRPITEFARASETLGRDPQAPLINLHGPAEIGMAARAFNEMQARIKRYIDDHTAMVGAISHDMRTPLARIRFKLEGAPSKVRDGVLQDVAQMEQMLSAVLRFIQDSSEPRERERVDLLSLVECAVDDAAVVGGKITLAESPLLVIDADPLAIQRLLTNLIDNAAKYATRAEVKLYQEDGDAVVEIADEGPGLAPEDLERVFTPFYRATAARTLDVGGVGLGLAVARSIARAHGGDVTLTPTAKGLLAQVRLPLPGDS